MSKHTEVSNKNTEQLNKHDIAIRKVLKTQCEKYGVLYYKVLKHPISRTYDELDIINKKLLLDSLENTIVHCKYMDTGIITNAKITYIINSKQEAIKLLEKCDKLIKFHMTKHRFNNITLLDEDAVYIKLYTDKEMNHELILSEQSDEAIKRYLNGNVIRYAISNNIEIPLLNFKDYTVSAFQMLDILLNEFEEKDLKYLDGLRTIFD